MFEKIEASLSEHGAEVNSEVEPVINEPEPGVVALEIQVDLPDNLDAVLSEALVQASVFVFF